MYVSTCLTIFSKRRDHETGDFCLKNPENVCEFRVDLIRCMHCREHNKKCYIDDAPVERNKIFLLFGLKDDEGENIRLKILHLRKAISAAAKRSKVIRNLSLVCTVLMGSNGTQESYNRV
jgi:hypothetical protein